MRPILPVAPILLALAAAQCGDGANPDAPVDEHAWTTDIQPIVASRCQGCHADGSVAPFSLMSYEQVQEVASAVSFSLESGAMPPVRTDPACRSFVNDHVMPDEERAALLAWIEAGLPYGDPQGFEPVAPPQDQLDGVDRVMRPAEPYEPSPVELDEYRCLPLAEDFSETTYVTAHHFVPDATQLVHHVILFLVPPSGVAGMIEEDAGAPGAGYPCYGGSGHGGQPMGVWAPGGGPQRFPAGSAFEIPAGARIVAQMHYNTASGDVRPDHSELQLVTTETPPPERVTMPILNGPFEIPAGAADATFEFTYQIPDDAPPRRLFSVMPHMHTLGRRIELERRRGGASECVSRVTDWSFEWQLFYDLFDDDQVEILAGDELVYRCTFDNSDGDAPVSFGEASSDEMCLYVAAMVGPPEPEPDGGLCNDFNSCYAACTDSSADCYLECTGAASSDCGGCMLQAVGECGMSQCPETSPPMLQCLTSSCTIDLMDIQGVLSCLGGPCREFFDANWSCVEPLLKDGTCAGIEACGVSL